MILLFLVNLQTLNSSVANAAVCASEGNALLGSLNSVGFALYCAS